MAEPKTVTGELVEFFDYHQPPLKKGNYRIRVSQTFRSTDKSIVMDTTNYRLVISAETDATRLPLSGPDMASVLLVAGIKDSFIFRIYDPVGRILTDQLEDEVIAPKGWADALRKDLSPLVTTPPTPEQMGALIERIAAHLGASFGSERTFTVGGERFSLNPQDILSVSRRLAATEITPIAYHMC